MFHLQAEECGVHNITACTASEATSGANVGRVVRQDCACDYCSRNSWTNTVVLVSSEYESLKGSWNFRAPPGLCGRGPKPRRCLIAW